MLGFTANLILFFYWLLYCFILPYKAKKSSQQSKIEPSATPRSRDYRGSMISLSLLGILAILAARRNGLPVFGQIHIDYRISLLACGFLAINMLLIDPLEWKYYSDEIRQRFGNLLPHTAKERFIWIGASLIVAISEEILYRAVFFGIFYQLTGDYWIAGFISAILFSAAHWNYGLAVLPSGFIVALGLQYFVKISGGLHVAIAIHLFHNLVNGIVYGWMWKRKLEADGIKEISPNSMYTAAISQKPD